MSKFGAVAIASTVAITIGYIAGYATQSPTYQKLSIYVADVTLVDAITRKPVNASLCFPESFFPTFQLSASASRTIPGTSYGPVRSEHELESGRWRITWIGTSGYDFEIRFIADGYQPVTLPAAIIQEISHQETQGGISGASVLPLNRVDGSEQKVNSTSNSPPGAL